MEITVYKCECKDCMNCNDDGCCFETIGILEGGKCEGYMPKSNDNTSLDNEMIEFLLNQEYTQDYGGAKNKCYWYGAFEGHGHDHDCKIGNLIKKLKDRIK